MPKTELESKTEAYLRTEVQKRGGLYYKFTSPGNVGVPDRIIVHDGKTIFVELKQEHGTLSKLQELQIARLKKAGATGEKEREGYSMRYLLRMSKEAEAIKRALVLRNGRKKKGTGGIVDDTRGQD